MKIQFNLTLLVLTYISFTLFYGTTFAQTHPSVYLNNEAKSEFENRISQQRNVSEFIEDMHAEVDVYVNRHKTDPEWIVSRLQLYWNTKYKEVYVKGMDFSHGAGSAPVPTVRFSGSRDWDTDYMVPELEDIMPYMDDPRGVYFQNSAKEGKPWEWVHPSETGHVIENINEDILDLAESAAFLYWLEGDSAYAVFAMDIFMKYIEGMHHRDPPLTVNGHHNKDLMGLQTFEVIHERVVVPLTMCYDFLYEYLEDQQQDLTMIQDVFRKWADQEIKYGVPGNNWNLMQARYITYLALVLESDDNYGDGKGQEYYIDQVLNQNSRKQKALKDVLNNFDPETGIWPEVAGYSIMVSDDILEVYCLIDKALNNNLLGQYPMLEKAILANFNYLFPDGYTTAYGDAKHSRLRFAALELLIAQFRKYNRTEKENLVTAQLKKFIDDDAYSREDIKSLFDLFYYVEYLNETPSANSFSNMVNPTFYSPNVSWIVQRNGDSRNHGMMISKNASLGNHSHANGINIELFAKGMVIATDCAAGNSYWAPNHKEYYSRFPAHNTVIVDGKSDYKTMNSTHAFEVKSIFPSSENSAELLGDYTFSNVSFTESATDALQERLTGSIRTSESSGYFIDIFRSARKDKQDKKHEYLFHSHGSGIKLSNKFGEAIEAESTTELSSENGDLKGYDYFTNKKEASYSDDFVAQFSMPSILNKHVIVNLFMKGYEGRKIFTVDAPYSRADSKKGIPETLYHKPIPTLVVRQTGEAQSRPFVCIIDAYNQDEEIKVSSVDFFDDMNGGSTFVGVKVTSTNDRIDYIYNDQSTENENKFRDGAFTGTYGVVSFEQKSMASIFLGNGKLIENGYWSISANQTDGGVLVEIDDEYLCINAEKPFVLSIPSDFVDQDVTLEVVSGSNPRKVFRGKKKKTKGVEKLAFELPEMGNIKIRINRK